MVSFNLGILKKNSNLNKPTNNSSSIGTKPKDTTINDILYKLIIYLYNQFIFKLCEFIFSIMGLDITEKPDKAEDKNNSSNNPDSWSDLDNNQKNQIMMTAVLEVIHLIALKHNLLQNFNK